MSSPVSSRIEDACDWLTNSVVNEGLLTGAVVGCWDTLASGKDAVVRAIGTDAIGCKLTPQSVYATYCMSKPLLAILVSTLAERGELSIDSRVGEVVPASDSLSRLTLRDVIEHRVDWGVPDGMIAVLLNSSEYANHFSTQFVRQLRVPRYSEYASWYLLKVVVEAVTGSPIDLLAEEVLRPYFRGAPAHLSAASGIRDESLAINGAIVAPDVVVPLLAERGSWLNWTYNPGYGGYMSLAASISLLGNLLKASNSAEGRMTRIANRLLEGGPVHVDDVLGRECRFGHGVFRDMTYFGLHGLLSRNSFGQVGLLGMSLVAADCDTGTVVGYHLSSYLDPETMEQWIRPTLVRKLLT